MTRFFIPLLAMSLTLALSAAEPQQINLPSSEDSFISASFVADDASGWIALARPEPWKTDLLRIYDGEIHARVAIDDAIVKAIRPLDAPDRYLIQGAGPDGPFFRVVDLRNGKATTIWDSLSLPAGLRSEEHSVSVSPDAERWAIASYSDETLHVAFGLIGDPIPRTKISITSEPVELPDGFEYDGAGIEFISSSKGRVLLAALWRGRVFIMDGEQVVSRLTPPNGASSIHFDTGSMRLWTISTSSVSAFNMNTLSERPTRLTVFAADRGTTRAYPLTGGRLATAFTREGVFTAEWEDSKGNGKQRAFAHSGEGATVAVSASGRAMIEFPEGPRSRRIFLHRDR